VHLPNLPGRQFVQFTSDLQQEQFEQVPVLLHLQHTILHLSITGIGKEERFSITLKRKNLEQAVTSHHSKDSIFLYG
jgi:hypothetical protein